LYVTLYFQGIDRINEYGLREPISRFQTQFGFPNITGIKTRAEHEIIVSVHEIDPSTGNVTEFNGVWSVPTDQGLVICSLLVSSPCQKLFPLNNEPIYFPDGIAIYSNDIFVSDPALGNIWKYNDNDESVSLWAGTDSETSINFLSGLPSSVIGLPNPKGRGFGVNGITIDKSRKILYAANSDLGLVVKILILDNGLAGTQHVLGNALTGQYFYDGIHFSKKKLYVTSPARFISGQLVPGFTILSANLKDDPVVFSPIIFDTLIDSPTDIITGCYFDNYECEDLLIVNIGFFSTQSTGIYVASE